MRKKCEEDGKWFVTQRASAKYCSDRCRKRASRKRPARELVEQLAIQQKASTRKSKGKAADAGENESSVETGKLTTVTLQRLAEAGRIDHHAGVLAVQLATHLDAIAAGTVGETAAGIASLSNRYLLTMDEAVRERGEQDDDPIANARKTVAFKIIQGGRADAPEVPPRTRVRRNPRA